MVTTKHWVGARSTRRVAMVVAVVAAAALLTACLPKDVRRLASDEFGGRAAGSPGGTLARDYLVDELRPLAAGANTSASGDAAYLQTFPGGTNVLAVFPGTDLANEYVMVGGHYDHLGSACRTSDPTDHICNGATDNAAGAAIVLDVARSLAQQPTRRSVIVALWDGEEDNLAGSQYYVEHPLIPMSQLKAYVNYDIQGANLLPSLRTHTFAVGAETGGSVLTDLVAGSRDQAQLQTALVSAIFGQGRSDYLMFVNEEIPTVFYSDSTGRCYHTAQDSADVVDFDKLEQQALMGKRVVRALANTNTPPTFVANRPLATYDDAVALRDVFDRALTEPGLFTSANVAKLTTYSGDFHRVVDEGRAAFDSADISLLLGDAVSAVGILTQGACSGFLPPG